VFNRRPLIGPAPRGNFTPRSIHLRLSINGAILAMVAVGLVLASPSDEATRCVIKIV